MNNMPLWADDHEAQDFQQQESGENRASPPEKPMLLEGQAEVAVRGEVPAAAQQSQEGPDAVGGAGDGDQDEEAEGDRIPIQGFDMAW